MKYLYYMFLEMYFQRELYKITSKTGQGKFNKTDLKEIYLPIPSLKVQEKIAKTLDKFTNYVAELQLELQSELQSRNRQYEYYRDKLLSEEHLNKVLNNYDICKYELRESTLGELGTFINGSGMPKAMFDKDGEIGAIHYGHIYTNYNTYVVDPIVKVRKNDATNLKKVKYGDLVIARTSENVEDVMKTIAYIGQSEVVTGGHTAIFRHKENPKFLSYLFNGSYNFIKQKNKFARGVKVIEISTEEMKKIKIKLPPIEIQEKIVEILDKFQELTQDVSGLLPDEIEKRQKQYEHYREKLLAFDTERTRGGYQVLSSDYIRLLIEAGILVRVKVFELKKNKLDEVCEILDSKRKPITKSKRIKGIYPYYGANGIQDYVNDFIFDGSFVLMGEMDLLLIRTTILFFIGLTIKRFGSIIMPMY